MVARIAIAICKNGVVAGTDREKRTSASEGGQTNRAADTILLSAPNATPIGHSFSHD